MDDLPLSAFESYRLFQAAPDTRLAAKGPRTLLCHGALRLAHSLHADFLGCKKLKRRSAGGIFGGISAGPYALSPAMARLLDYNMSEPVPPN